MSMVIMTMQNPSVMVQPKPQQAGVIGRVSKYKNASVWAKDYVSVAEEWRFLDSKDSLSSNSF